MAQPKTGRSHTRSSLFIASGLYVSGVLGGAGVQYSANMALAPLSAATSNLTKTKVYSATGKTAPGLKFVPPNVGITIVGVGLSFMTAPNATATFRVSLRSIPVSGTQVHKGYLATAGKHVMYFAGLSATIPAGNAAGVCVNKAGGLVSGQDMNVTVYYTRNT